MRKDAQHVPSGASTGTHEALELRDGEAGVIWAKACADAIKTSSEVIEPAILGMDAANQGAL